MHVCGQKSHAEASWTPGSDTVAEGVFLNVFDFHLKVVTRYQYAGIAWGKLVGDALAAAWHGAGVKLLQGKQGPTYLKHAWGGMGANGVTPVAFCVICILCPQHLCGWNWDAAQTVPVLFV